MKLQNKLVLLFIIYNYSIVLGQQCLSSGCSNLVTNYPNCAVMYTTNTNWNAVGSVFNGGEYAYFDVIQGSTYQWTTCNTYGGSQSGDAQLTLKSMSNSNICYSDNSGLSACPYAPYISWTATFTGQVKVLVSLYSCQNTSVALAILVWRRTNSCSNITAPSTFSSSSTSTSITLNWNAIPGATSYVIYDCNSCDAYLTSVTTNTVTFSGLQPSSPYQLKVMAINGSCNSVKSACQNITTQSSCATPFSQANSISFSNVGSDQLTLGWSSGSGTNRIVVAKSGSSILGTPSDGSSYTSNSTFGSGSTINSNEYVLYNGTGSSATVYGLSPSTTYYFRIFEYNCTGSTTKYNTSTASNNPRNQTTLCNSSISPTSKLNVGRLGGSFSISVSANSTCSWTAQSNDSWISITSGGSGTGNGTCNYSVSQNNTGSIRNGSIYIANRTFDVKQFAPPIADFTANKNSFNAGEQVNLYDNSSNEPSTWSWTVSGGNQYVSSSLNAQNIQFNLTNPGSYKVSLTVGNNSGTDTKEVIGFITVKSVQGVPVNPSGTFVIQKNYQKVLLDPIQLGTGTYTYAHTDFTIPVIGNNLDFTRYYNSFNNTRNGSLGYGWSHSYNYSIQNLGDSVWDLYYPDGHSARFIPIYNSGGLSFPLYGGTYDSLIKTSQGDYWMYTKERHVYKFDNNGRFYQLDNPNGNQVALTYSGNNLTAIMGSGGRALLLGYNTNSQIISVQAPSGRLYKYSYDGNGNLTYVIAPKGDTIQFTYTSTHQMLIVVNGLGNTIVSNTYSSQNRVISQADGNNKVTQITYNSPSYGITKATLPDNSILTYHHDSFYRVIKTVDALGKISTTSYDDNNNSDSILNEKSQLTINQYDKFGNLLVQNLPGNKTFLSSFNQFQKITSLTDPKNQTTLFIYNTIGNLIQIHFPNNSENYFDYNTNGTLKFSVKANGDSTYYFYNSSGDITQVKTPTGIKLYTYDADGRPMTAKDENGNTTTFTYDNNNNIITITDALGKSILFTYDSDNQLITYTDKKGYITRYFYDKKGNKIASRNPLQEVDSFYYDVRDNLIRWKDANGNNTTYTYDANSRKTQMTNSAGSIKYEYDDLGNITKITDPANHSVNFDYNIYNYIASTTNALSKTNAMSYDKVGNITEFTNFRNKTKGFSYNSLNQLTQVIDVDNENTQYQYNQNGNLNQLKDANNHIQNFIYGKSDRLASYTDAANNSYSMVYDSVGNIRTINKPKGNISQNYDALNRLVQSTLSSGDIYTYVYDANYNITSASNNLGTTQFIYDSLNRMVRYIDPFNKQVSYKYNAVGSITVIVYPGNDTVKYTYDNANRLTTVKDWKNNIFTYTYDSAGNVKRLLYPNGIRCDYLYDAINRITSKMTYLPSNAVLYGQQYNYFDDSVRETRFGSFPSTLEKKRFKYQYRSDDALLSDSLITYANDSNGNRIKEVQGNDTTRYTYTTDQLLSSYVKGTLNVTYGYDAFGHRLTRTQGTNQTRFVLNVNSPLSFVLQTTDGAGNKKASYVYGLGLLESIDSAGKELFYHFDSRHNAIAISDKNDSIKATYTYTLYGTLTNQTGTLTQPFTFLGEFGVEQENNSWYYIRARYYDTNTGRFLSKDPLFGDEFDPQTLNRYIYSMNNPLEMFDATGLSGNKDYDFMDYASSIASIFKNLSKTPQNEFSIKMENIFKTFAGKNALRVFEVREYTYKLYNYYYEIENTINAFMKGDISQNQALGRIMLSVGKILPYSSSLISMKAEVNDLANAFMERRISDEEFYFGIFNSSMNAFLPGWSQLNSLSNKILNGYANGLNYVGDKLGGVIYNIFYKK